MCFDQRYTYSTTSKSLINSVKIIKSHGNYQSGGPFGHCFRCVLWGVWLCMSLNIHPALWESINCDKTCKKNPRNNTNVSNSKIGVKAILLWTLLFSFMSILENARRRGRMDKEKKWISPTLAKDARRLECFLLFLILANQAGQNPQKSLRDTKC